MKLVDVVAPTRLEHCCTPRWKKPSTSC